jgi:hypothetical protein
MKSKKNARVPLVASSAPPPTPEQIAALAHAIWIDRGRPEGRDMEHWLEAERQLRGEAAKPMAAGELSAAPDDVNVDRPLTSRVDREIDRIVGPHEQRSPTSL